MGTRIVTFETNQQFAELWSKFTLGHPEAGFGHLPGVFDLAKAAPHVKDRSLLVLDERDQPIAALPLFDSPTKKLRVVPWRVLVSSIEFPGGPLFASGMTGKQRDEMLESLVGEAKNIARQQGTSAIHISYPTVIGDVLAVDSLRYYPLRQLGFTEENNVSMVLDLRPEPDKLLGGLNKSCRGAIKKARDMGAECRLITRKADWMSCFALNTKTLGALSDSKEWMSVAWDSFVGTGSGFAMACYWQDAIVGVVLCVTTGSSCYYWKSYRQQELGLTGANNLTLWEAILHSKASGARHFELGSLDFGNDKQAGISKFKQSFGGSAVYQLRGTLYCHQTRRAFIDLVEALRARGRQN